MLPLNSDYAGMVWYGNWNSREKRESLLESEGEMILRNPNYIGLLY